MVRFAREFPHVNRRKRRLVRESRNQHVRERVYNTVIMIGRLAVRGIGKTWTTRLGTERCASRLGRMYSGHRQVRAFRSPFKRYIPKMASSAYSASMRSLPQHICADRCVEKTHSALMTSPRTADATAGNVSLDSLTPHPEPKDVATFEHQTPLLTCSFYV